MADYAENYTRAVRGGESDLQRKLLELKPKFADAAQKVYDAWGEGFDDEYGDPEVGFGGICQDIAGALGDVLNEHGIDSIVLDNNGVGDQHVWVGAYDPKHFYHVDIEPHHYETGGGYNWKKIPGVKFGPEHIDIIPHDRSDFADQIDDG